MERKKESPNQKQLGRLLSSKEVIQNKIKAEKSIMLFLEQFYFYQT